MSSSQETATGVGSRLIRGLYLLGAYTAINSQFTAGSGAPTTTAPTGCECRKIPGSKTDGAMDRLDRYLHNFSQFTRIGKVWRGPVHAVQTRQVGHFGHIHPSTCGMKATEQSVGGTIPS